MRIKWSEIKEYVAVFASFLTVVTFFIGYYEKDN